MGGTPVFLSYDPETRAYCVITLPHRGAIPRDDTANARGPCSANSGGSSLNNRPTESLQERPELRHKRRKACRSLPRPDNRNADQEHEPDDHDRTAVEDQNRPSCER